jgi:hypothetical protein
LVCSRVTKRPVFSFVCDEVRPGDALQVFCFDDDYSFGILQSNTHWQWFVAKCSKLTERFRYTPESVFDTFPWPQSPTANDIKAVGAAGREVRRVRDASLQKTKGGLRAVYRTLELPGKNPLKGARRTRRRRPRRLRLLREERPPPTTPRLEPRSRRPHRTRRTSHRPRYTARLPQSKIPHHRRLYPARRLIMHRTSRPIRTFPVFCPVLRLICIKR